MKINNLQNILTQSNSMTAEPMFIVYSKREVVADSSYSYDKCFYIKTKGDDYPRISVEEYEDLMSDYNNATDCRRISADLEGIQVDYELPEDPCSGGEFNPEDWELVYVKLVDKFEQAFFIRQNAENYIRNNSHNLRDGAFIYVESAYRNLEWQQIRELLLSLASAETIPT